MVYITKYGDAANAIHDRGSNPRTTSFVRRMVRCEHNKSKYRKQNGDNGPIFRHERKIGENGRCNPVSTRVESPSITARAKRNGYVLINVPIKYMHLVPFLLDVLEENKRKRQETIAILRESIGAEIMSMVEEKKAIFGNKMKLSALSQALLVLPQ